MPPGKNKTFEPQTSLLTVKDVAILDCCSEKTVRRAITAGLLEVIRLGPGKRLLRIHPKAHQAYRSRCSW